MLMRWTLGLLALASSALADPAVTTFTLANGMQGVVIEDHRAPVVTHMVWYRVGSADEPPGKSGIAHFLEHLMFKGTDQIPDGAFSKIIAANGGTDNAFTSYDYTAYHQRISADRLDLVMGMEADRMRNLRLTEEQVTAERAVILEERSARTDNSPQALFGEQVTAAQYLNHHYGIPVIGWRHEMEGLTRQDALDWYKRYYAPDNAILVVAGDVTPAAVQALAEKHYGPIAAEGRPPEPRASEPPQLSARRLEMRDPRVRQPYVMRSYLAPTYDRANPRESAALEVLAQVLGGGLTSRLAQSLQLGSKIALDVGAWYSADSRDAQTFGVYGVPAAGTSLDAVEQAIDAVIADLIARGPTDEELTRIKRRMRASQIYAQDDQASLARQYGAALAIGQTVADVQGWMTVIDQVTAADVVKAAKDHLVPERSVTGRLLGQGEAG